MNLKVLKKSRKPHRPGDVFAYSVGDGFYRFGRILRTDAQPNVSGGKWLLCYAFRAKSKVMTEVPELNEAQMILEPFVINKLPWSHGYFVTVANTPLTSNEVKRRHYFKGANGTYRDEYCRPYRGKPKMYSDSGLWSYVYFDYEVSKKLGLPVDPNGG